MFLEYALEKAVSEGTIKNIFYGPRDRDEAVAMQLWLANLNGDFFATFNEDPTLVGAYKVDYSNRFIYGLHPLSVEELAVYFLYALPTVVSNVSVSFAKDCLREWFNRCLLYTEVDRAMSIFTLMEMDINDLTFAVQL